MNRPPIFPVIPTRWLAAFAYACGFVLASSAQELPVKEHTLSNGMKILLVKREGDPTVAGGWVAHVGSANERPGITGIAHLFEHMMFKGTPTIGTKDAKKDAEVIDRNLLSGRCAVQGELLLRRIHWR